MQFMDIVLHLDRHLALLVQQYGLWIYGILFVIVFAETGFVVTPFLPGDSLLFVAGALAAIGEGGMDIFVLMGVLTVAAVLGNTLNYQIGRFLKREPIRRLIDTAKKHGWEQKLREGLARTPIASVGPAVSDELKSHGLTAAIHPAEEAFFMRPLISAMATALAKNPPRKPRAG